MDGAIEVEKSNECLVSTDHCACIPSNRLRLGSQANVMCRLTDGIR